MKKVMFEIIMGILILFSINIVSAQEEEKEQEGFVFTSIKEIKTTSIKNQARSSTCWSFSGISFIETELIRMGRDSVDLSEMFIVRKTYPIKARNYVRYRGNTTFGAGGLFGNLIHCVKNYGLVPEEVYKGKLIGESQHNHVEMDAVLKNVLNAVIQNRTRKISTVWPELIDSILDIYLGQVPEQFTFRGKTYTPKSFQKMTGFNPDKYVQITSYTHHPFYQQFNLEIPDNWADKPYYNIPLSEFMAIIDYALEGGYSVAWDGDVSEKTFNQKEGVAILPQKDWEEKTKSERDSTCKQPEPEKKVTQKMRQNFFDNYTSKDDHLMHVTGLAEDQNGVKYYITKNSWGTKDSKFNGFIHMSESYIRAKTISIMVAKEAIPEDIASKLKI